MTAANAFVPTFIAAYNAKFAKPPRDAFDAHRPLYPIDVIDRICCLHELRTMTGNLVVHFELKTCLVVLFPALGEFGRWPLCGRAGEGHRSSC